MTPDGSGLERRHLDRKTPWRLVKKYCQAAGIDPSRLGGRGIGIHSLRKTAINDAIRNGATMHEVREFAGHADIRTTEVYFIRKEEDAEVAAQAHPDSPHGTQGRVSPWRGPTRIQTRSPCMIVLVPLLGFARYEQAHPSWKIPNVLVE